MWSSIGNQPLMTVHIVGVYCIELVNGHIKLLFRLLFDSGACRTYNFLT